jgi:cell division protein FtsQ
VSTPAATAAGKRRATARSSRSAPARSHKPRTGTPRSAPRRKPAARTRGGTRLSLSAWRLWLLAAAIAAGALAITYFAWFRHSSFVAVENVKVEGVSSTDREQITSALTQAAQGMSTLDVDASKLASAVSGFPAVASVTAHPDFPHGLTVEVSERRPVLIASDGDREVAVASDGSLLPGLALDGLNLPTIRVDQMPDAGRLDGTALDETRVVGLAPGPLQPLIEDVAPTSDDGVVATLKGGIDVRFGTASKARAKWAAAAAVLADPKVTSLEYVDVQVPSRPAIGG